MLDAYKPPSEQWNECLPTHLVPCPQCGTTGMIKVGAAPDGSHLLMQCSDVRCQEVSKLSG